MPKANGVEMSPDVRDPLIGVLEPRAVLGPHRNISYGGEAPVAAGPSGKPLRVPAPELQIHQSAVTDIVIVRRGQGLDDARLDPLPTPTQVPHAEGTNDATYRCLASVPTAGVHSRIHRTFTVRLSLQIQHPARLGRNDTLVPFYTAERALLPKARDRAIDQPRVELREVVIRQPPVGHVSGAEGLHQHIGLAREPDGLIAAFFRVEIQDYASLSPVPRNPGRLKTKRVTAGWFDLDYFGPVVGHYQGA